MFSLSMGARSPDLTSSLFCASASCFSLACFLLSWRLFWNWGKSARIHQNTKILTHTVMCLVGLNSHQREIIAPRSHSHP